MKAGDTFGNWTITDRFLGGGGNGVVWTARHEDGRVGAFKLLRQSRDIETKKKRFVNEVAAMAKCHDIEGVLRLLDYDCPVPSKHSPLPWLVTPIATPLDEVCDAFDLREAVTLCYSMSQTLSAMHAIDVSHRDIKPGNIFHLDGAWHLGDFGLVSYPGKTDVTREGDKVGAIHYIAPEMLRDGSGADGTLADVYSLGKLLWKLVTHEPHPLAGMHVRGLKKLSLTFYVAADGLVTLEALIERMTHIEPSARPSMREVSAELAAWLAPAPPRASSSDVLHLAGRVRAIQDESVARTERMQTREALATSMREAIYQEAEATLLEIEKSFAGLSLINVNVSKGGGSGRYLKQHTYRDARVVTFEVAGQVQGERVGGTIRSGLEFAHAYPKSAGVEECDFEAAVPFAAGHVMTLSYLFGGAWRNRDWKLWSEEHTCVIGQPRQQAIARDLAARLVETLPDALTKFLDSVDAYRRAKDPLLSQSVEIAGTEYLVHVVHERHLKGLRISAERTMGIVAYPLDQYIPRILGQANWDRYPPTNDDVQTKFEDLIEGFAFQVIDEH